MNGSFDGGSVSQLFATPVWTFKPKGAAQLVADVERRLHALRLADGAGPTSRFWQSADTLHRDAAFEPLVRLIDEASQAVLSLLDYDCALAISGMWGNIGGRAAPLHAHTHPNNFLSGIVYVKIPPGSGGTLFEDPRPQNRVMRPRVRRDNPLNALEFHYQGASGDLVMFPAWLAHSVTPNQSGEERITVAFNLATRGPLGSHETFSYVEPA